MTKFIYLFFIFFIPIFASDLQRCSKYTNESDCKFKESNNCTWIIGQQRCVSKRKNKSIFYSNKKNHPHRKNGHLKGGRKGRHR